MMLRNITIAVLLLSSTVQAQQLTLSHQAFALKNVTGSIIDFQGEKVLKIERDLKALPFDEQRLESTVDEPTFAKLLNLPFYNGTIEVKMYSQLQNPVPNNFKQAQGFIGVYFRIADNDSAFESIYLRPRVGRAGNQFMRNHTVQYFAYPNNKFETLRKKASGKYEGSAPVALHEWITMRIEVQGNKAEMFINNAPYSTFVVDSLLGTNAMGSIGLYVDIGTIGYFKDLKVTPASNPAYSMVKDWERAKAYTKAYLEAMPEKAYGLKPVKSMRSFAAQMLHLADANYGFTAAATGQQSKVAAGALEKMTNPTKTKVIEQVMASYDFVIHNVQQLTAEQWAQQVQLFGQFTMSREQALQKCFEHQTHHRGQTTAYLRMAGATPPPEQLF